MTTAQRQAAAPAAACPPAVDEHAGLHFAAMAAMSMSRDGVAAVLAERALSRWRVTPIEEPHDFTATIRA